VSRVVPCGVVDGRTDRHDEAISRLSQLCDHACKGDANVKNEKFANKKGKMSSLCLTKIGANYCSCTGKLIDGAHAAFSNM